MTMRKVSCDGKLTDRWRSLAKLFDRVLPDEKVDEWGWNPTRKEWAAITRRVAEESCSERNA